MLTGEKNVVLSSRQTFLQSLIYYLINFMAKGNTENDENYHLFFNNFLSG